MHETVCPHGLNVGEIESNNDVITYCSLCVYDALYDGSLDISMGIHPNIKRRIRNIKRRIRKKEKSNRKKGKLHG